MAEQTPRPPSGLQAEGKRHWRRVLTEFVLEDWQLKTLEVACRALDLMHQAQADIDKNGLSMPDRFGQLKANPAASVLRDSRSGYLQAMKALNLDYDEPGAVGRPARGGF